MAIYRVKVGSKEYEVTVRDTSGGGAEVCVEGRTFYVDPVGAAAKVTAATAAPAPAPAAMPAAAAPASPSPAPTPVAGGGNIAAPIPGVVTKILVSVGDSVQAGQVVLKLEAMKMENDISTAVAGSVKQVAVSEGAEVSDGQLLLVVE